MTKKHMKRYSASLIIREIKTTVRYHLTAIRMASSERQKSTSVVKEMGKLDPCCTVGGNGNGAATVGNGVEVPQEIKTRATL